MNRFCNKYLDNLNLNKISKDYVSQIIKLAEGGEAEALAAYSILQILGIGVEKNAVQAKERLRLYAKSGDANGMFLCGMLASDPSFGFGGDIHLSENYLRAVVFGSSKGKLSNEKTAIAARTLGDYYYGGHSEFEKDSVESLRAYKVAANLGDLDSSVLVGCMLIRGVSGLFDIDIEKDESAGVQMLVFAHSKGCASATDELVRYYLRKAAQLGSSIEKKADDMNDILNVLSTVEWML